MKKNYNIWATLGIKVKVKKIQKSSGNQTQGTRTTVFSIFNLMEHLAKCFRIDVEHYLWNNANNPAQNQLLNPRYMFSLAQGRSKLGRISGNPFEEIPQMRNISFPQMEICFNFLKVHGNGWIVVSSSIRFSWLSQTCLTLCDPMDYSTPGFPVLHHLPELAQTHVHWVSDGIQPSHPLSSLSPPTFNLSQHQGLFKWVSSSHRVAKVLKF